MWARTGSSCVKPVFLDLVQNKNNKKNEIVVLILYETVLNMHFTVMYVNVRLKQLYGRCLMRFCMYVKRKEKEKKKRKRLKRDKIYLQMAFHFIVG